MISASQRNAFVQVWDAELVRKLSQNVPPIGCALDRQERNQETIA